jgi:hypothetical protein
MDDVGSRDAQAYTPYGPWPVFALDLSQNGGGNELTPVLINILRLGASGKVLAR